MPIVVIIGPSGAGKSTLVDMYIAEHPTTLLHKSVTTRPVRNGEDTSHTFVTDAEFTTLDQQQKLIQPVSAYGYRYALPKLPNDISGTIFVLIRATFVQAFLTIYPKTYVIQVEAPLETLLERLTLRGDTNERIDTIALQAEIEKGRSVASAIVATSQSLPSAYKSFSASVTTAQAVI